MARRDRTYQFVPWSRASKWTMGKMARLLMGRRDHSGAGMKSSIEKTEEGPPNIQVSPDKV